MRACLWLVLCQCSRISFFPLALRQMSLFWPKTQLLFPQLVPKAVFIYWFPQSKRCFAPLHHSLFSSFAQPWWSIVCHASTRVWEQTLEQREQSFALPVISILSAHHCTKQPSVPFITGFVLTKLSLWPHLPQPWSEIGGGGGGGGMRGSLQLVSEPVSSQRQAP